MGQRFNNPISKVDEHGLEISNFKVWAKKNPDKVFYDSKLEFNICTELDFQGVEYTRSPVIELSPASKSMEVHHPPKVRNNKNKLVKDKTKSLSIRLKPDKNIVYTPDLFLPDSGTYLEVKGYDTDVFRLRWRMFKKLGYKGFIIHNMEELNIVLEYLNEKI